MQIGDSMKICGVDGSYVEVGPDEDGNGAVFIETREDHDSEPQGVTISAAEAALVVNALLMAVRA
jgi:hypothetical protein